MRFSIWGLSLVAAVTQLQAIMTVELLVTDPPVAPVGEMRTWFASVADAGEGTLWYRYRVREPDGHFRLIRDFGPSNVLEWTVGDSEGTYELEVSVRNLETGESAATSALFDVQSRLSSDTPVVNSTWHPMVFMYSAPGCAEGARMRVRFESPDGFVQESHEKPCLGSRSMNFYLAGLRPQTDYRVRHFVSSTDGVEEGPELSFTTFDWPADVPLPSSDPVPLGTPQQIIVQSSLGPPPYATDLMGNVVWFYQGWISKLTRAVAGGYFLGVVEDHGRDQSFQILRKFDVTGMTVLETNAARVSEQLVAMGRRPISSFHHELRELPDGRFVVLGIVEQILTDVQGPGPVNIVGEAVLVLNENMEVVWAWDAFDHLNPQKPALLNEKCNPNACSPLFLAEHAASNDWLHANSISLTPDGDFLVSIRHLDWVIKINYDNGNGDGAVVWRLGKGGDFKFESSAPYPWFSHQHDAAFDPDDPTKLMVFDNGNTHRLENPEARSRGQVIRLDEKNLTATLELNVDLGDYSAALGSTQKLDNGNYHFGLGFAPGTQARAIEVTPDGKIVYQQTYSSLVYRSYRLRSLFSGAR